jgi:hypothetical protein
VERKVVLEFEGEIVEGMVVENLGAQRSAREESREGPGMSQVE